MWCSPRSPLPPAQGHGVQREPPSPGVPEWQQRVEAPHIDTVLEQKLNHFCCPSAEVSDEQRGRSPGSRSHSWTVVQEAISREGLPYFELTWLWAGSPLRGLQKEDHCTGASCAYLTHGERHPQRARYRDYSHFPDRWEEALDYYWMNFSKNEISRCTLGRAEGTSTLAPFLSSRDKGGKD